MKLTSFFKNLPSLRSESGVALVEFALVLPVLVMILFGVLDFGKAFNYWNDETHLANEAARWAAVNKNPSTIDPANCPSGTTLQQCIARQADTPELRNGGTSSLPSGAQVCISYPNGTSNVGDPVQVKVKTAWHPFSFVVKSLPSVNLVGESTMRLEATPTNFSANPC